MANIYLIHTDGSCLGNPGPGGWAFHAHFGAQAAEFYGFDPQTTNNRMELHALSQALLWLRQNAVSGDQALIRLDSRYVLDGLISYLPNWKRNSWRKADRKPVLNADLWMRADELHEAVKSSGIKCVLEWVRGHAGDPGNERVDVLARTAAEAGGEVRS